MDPAVALAERLNLLHDEWLRTGTVVAIGAGNVTVDLAGAQLVVPHLSSYSPTVGHAVQVLVAPGVKLCLGAPGSYTGGSGGGGGTAGPHVHQQADVTSLTTTLAGKSATTHTHPVDQAAGTGSLRTLGSGPLQAAPGDHGPHSSGGSGAAIDSAEYSSTGQTIPNTSNAEISFPTANRTIAGITRSTRGSGHAFTLAVAGTYSVTATVRYANTSSATRECYIELLDVTSGAIVVGASNNIQQEPYPSTLNLAVTRYYPAGSVICISAFQSSGAPLALDTVTAGWNRINITPVTTGILAGAHAHVETEVTSLVTDLAGKAPTVHAHTEADVTSLTTDLANKSDLSHTHAGGGSGGGTVGPIASVYQTAVQSIPNNAWTAVLFEAETYDTDNGHSTSTNTSRWTCPAGQAGFYLVSGLVYFGSGTAGVRLAAIAKNGTRLSGSSTRDQPCADGGGNGVDAKASVVQLTAGDYVELHCLQNNGAAVNTYATAPETSSLDVAFLRPMPVVQAAAIFAGGVGLLTVGGTRVQLGTAALAGAGLLAAGGTVTTPTVQSGAAVLAGAGLLAAAATTSTPSSFIASNSAAGGTNGTTVTTGNSGGASGTAFNTVNITAGNGLIFDSTRAARGSLSYRHTIGGTGATDAAPGYTTAIGTQTTIWGRFYYYATANPAATHRIAAITASGGASRLTLYHMATGKMQMDVGAAFGGETTGTIPLNQWVRIEFKLIGGAGGSGEFKTYFGADPHSSTATQTVTSATATVGAIGAYEIGPRNISQASFVHWTDEHAWSITGYPGPAP